jgi:hypothetical protein
MVRPNDLMLATAGALAMAVVLFPAFASAASERSVLTIEFSAQNEFPKKKAVRKKKNSAAQKNIAPQNKIAPVPVLPHLGSPNSGVPKTAHRIFTPRSNNSRIVSAARIRGVPMRGAGRTSISGRNYSIWRSGYRVRRGVGGWRTFVALGTLGTLAIGSAEYYPYAYIQAPEEYCDGQTEDGCQLVFDDVQTMEGNTAGQCVAYCPWQ